jgi:hypothetical protein
MAALAAKIRRAVAYQRRRRRGISYLAGENII